MAFEVLDSITDATKLDNVSDVYAEGDYVYTVSSTDNSLTIIDASDPTNLVVEGYLQDATYLNSAHKVIKIGDYLYVAFVYTTYPYRRALAIVDISDKSTPVRLSSIGSGSGNVSFMFLKNNYLFFGFSSSGDISVIDVSDPENPYAFASVNNGLMAGIDQILVDSNGVGFTLNTSANLITLFNLKDYFNGTYLGDIKDVDKLDDVTEIIAEGDYVYVKRSGYLTIINASDPTNMKIEGYLNNASLDGIGGIAKYGNYIISVKSSSPYTMAFVDVSDPSSPSLYSTPSASASRIVVSGDYAYLIGIYSSYPFKIYDISDPSSPSYKGYVNSLGQGVRRFVVEGDYAYLPRDTGQNRFTIVDISDKENPVLKGEVIDATYFEGACDVVVLGSYAYVLGSKYFVVVDISDKENPSIYSYLSISYSSPVSKLIYDENYFYAISSGSLIKIDASDIDDLTLVGVFKNNIATINGSNGISNGDIEGNVIFTAGFNVSSKVGAFDISKMKGNTDVALSSIDTTLLGSSPSSISLDEHDNLFIAIISSDSVVMYDVSDDTSPTYLGTMTEATKLDSPYDVNSLENEYVISSSSVGNYLVVIDFSDSDNPVIINEIQDNTNLEDIVKTYRVEGVIYCACQDGDRITAVDISNYLPSTFTPKVMLI